MVTDAEDTISLPSPLSAIAEKWKICDELVNACDTGHVGDIVAKHEKLILEYYKDVLEQAQKSFASAKSIAHWLLGVGCNIGIRPSNRCLEPRTHHWIRDE